MSLRVLKPGLLTTVQDLGRSGYQKFGVVVGGAMDSFALRTANLLIGNEEGAAALEMTVLGPHIYFEADTVIAICGGDLSPTIDGHPVPLWRMVLVNDGSTLRFNSAKTGCRSYLAVAGGVDVPFTMGSRSTYLRAGIGGFKGRALKQGDVLSVGKSSDLANRIHTKLQAAEQTGHAAQAVHAGHAAQAEQTGHRAQTSLFKSFHLVVSSRLLPEYSPNPTLRVVKGEQFERFSEASIAAFYREAFTLSPQSDRMGYRLAGPKLDLRKKEEMTSEAVTFGSVQVPADGNPIVLMADRQTTGGYPKIAQVISVDLPIIAQLSLGAQISFREVTLEEAQELYYIRETEIQWLKMGIRMHF